MNGRGARVHASDRGLAYGDGLFETMAVHDGRIPRLDLHFERLREGCVRLDIACPEAALIEADLRALLPPGGRCVAKVIVTRGSAARGYRPPAHTLPTRIVGVGPWPEYPATHYSDGVRLGICRTPLAENPALAGLKHLGRLEQVLGQAELRATGHVEGLMSTTRGHVIGGTASNVFCVEHGVVCTPRLDRAGVRGVARRLVIARAVDLGLTVREDDLTLARLTGADEVFVTNAIFGLWPVREIGAMKISLGEIARRLMREIGVNDSG